MSVKKYKTYKDSGEYWLGEIPESWTNIRLRLISTITKGKKPKKDYDKFEEGLYPYLSMEFLRGKSENPTYANPQEGNLLVVEEGDILILWDGSNAGEIVQAKAGVLSSTMAKIELKSDLFNSSFLNYYLQRAQQHIKNHNIGMGIPHVNGKILRDLSLLIPPLSEQHQIAAFLDYKTALIDEIIAKKERLIELLQAKRQATINEVVTGKKVWNAANQTWEAPAKVKDSGVEWLGEIPEEWEVTKVKWELEFHNNMRIPIESVERADRQGRFPYYGASGIIDYVDSYIFDGKYILVGEDGANILSRSTPLAFMASGKFWVNNHAHILKSKNGIDEYFCFQLELNDYTTIATGSAQPKLTKDAIGNILIIIPPIEIQRIIVKYLYEFNTKSEYIESKLHTQIQSLKSYRQSLISEAVTGKIDVREWEEAKINV